MLQLRQLHFQLALVRAGALGEDVQDQAGAVDHARAEVLLEVALLHRAEQVVDQHQVGVQRAHHLGHFVGLAAADVETRIGRFDARDDAAQHLGAGGFHQLGELGGAALGVAAAARVRQHEDGALAFLLTIKHVG